MWAVRPIYIIRGLTMRPYGFTWGEANLLHICPSTTRRSGTKEGLKRLCSPFSPAGVEGGLLPLAIDFVPLPLVDSRWYDSLRINITKSI